MVTPSFVFKDAGFDWIGIYLNDQLLECGRTLKDCRQWVAENGRFILLYAYGVSEAPTTKDLT